MQIKLKTRYWLPIFLVIVLPGITIFMNADNALLLNARMAANWIVTSILLYALWHVLWLVGGTPIRFRIPLIPITIAVFAYIAQILIQQRFPEMEENEQIFLIVRIVMVSFLFGAIQYATRVQERYSLLRIEKEKIQKENYRTQLRVLQANIDPHFLFNSLNTLRSLIRQGHNSTDQFVLSLSDFYRQILKNNENTTLSLSQELEMLESYIFLMKSRNEKAVDVHLEIDDRFRNLKLPTMALQIVLENCFKHNSMNSNKPLKIKLVANNETSLSISNNVQPKIGEIESSGYGLQQLERRYTLLGVEKGIEVIAQEAEFTVRLKLIKG